MRLIAKIIRISDAKFHCNRLTAVQDIHYTSLGLCIYLSVDHTRSSAGLTQCRFIAI